MKIDASRSRLQDQGFKIRASRSGLQVDDGFVLGDRLHFVELHDLAVWRRGWASAVGKVNRRLVAQGQDLQHKAIPVAARDPVEADEPGGSVVEIVGEQLAASVEARH